MTSMVFMIVKISRSLLKCNYLKKEKTFVNFLLQLWNLHQILNIFLKKMIVIANVFPKLQTVKHLVRPLSKKHRFRTSFHSLHVRGCQTLVKSTWAHFYYVFSSFWREMICAISSLLNFEIIGVFVKTLTADYKHLVPDYKNLLFAIQMQLS